MSIERLTTAHDLDAFDCGEQPLNNYLRLRALRHQESGYGLTFVAVGDTPRVLGYHTIATCSVDREAIPRSTPYPRIPAILLARLAVDQAFQGQGLGKALLVDALRRARLASELVGVHAVAVDAMNQNAKDFYLKFDFKQLEDDDLHLYLPMTTIRRLFS